MISLRKEPKMTDILLMVCYFIKRRGSTITTTETIMRYGITVTSVIFISRR